MKYPSVMAAAHMMGVAAGATGSGSSGFSYKRNPDAVTIPPTDSAQRRCNYGSREQFKVDYLRLTPWDGVASTMSKGRKAR